jgi:hypothetical protein
MKKLDRSSYGQEGVHWTVNPESGCWEWIKCKDKKGYGRAFKDRAHRVIFERFKGPVKEGLELDHLCRNRGCVNPDHLEQVPSIINTQRGESTPFTIKSIKFIRDVASFGAGSVRLAELFGVHRSCIWQIIRRKTWANT